MRKMVSQTVCMDAKTMLKLLYNNLCSQNNVRGNLYKRKSRPDRKHAEQPKFC